MLDLLLNRSKCLQLGLLSNLPLVPLIFKVFLEFSDSLVEYALNCSDDLLSLLSFLFQLFFESDPGIDDPFTFNLKGLLLEVPLDALMVSDTRLFTASLLQPDIFEELLVPEFLNLSIPLLIARDSASSSLGR